MLVQKNNSEMKINDIIHNRRKEFGISQRELSRLSGVRAAAISEFESGKKSIYSHSLEKLCKILELVLKPANPSKKTNGKE